jgi:hypothetical protein
VHCSSVKAASSRWASDKVEQLCVALAYNLAGIKQQPELTIRDCMTSMVHASGP